ncbi:hypothetical protein FACS1894111_11850 [Clostridia bacterium]|nr:hypothetical protein FACS1894111_11850 [Clostridia bacterium]
MSFMRYKAKRGIWWILVLLFINAFLIWEIFRIVTGQATLSAWIFLLILLLCDIALLIANHYYVILENDVLTFVFGFSKKQIDCKKIHSITKTHTLLATSALSFDRLHIEYLNESSGTGEVMISVADNNKLIDDLLKINPNIQV